MNWDRLWDIVLNVIVVVGIVLAAVLLIMVIVALIYAIPNVTACDKVAGTDILRCIDPTLQNTCYLYRNAISCVKGGLGD